MNVEIPTTLEDEIPPCFYEEMNKRFREERRPKWKPEPLTVPEVERIKIDN